MTAPFVSTSLLDATRLATPAVEALLRGHGARVWRTGAAARAALVDAPIPAWVELITDGDASTCDVVLGTVASLANPAQVDLTRLDGRPIEDVLRTRGITIDAIAVDSADMAGVLDPFEGRAHLAAGVLRSIAPPDTAFRDHPALLVTVGQVIAWTDFPVTAEVRRTAIRDSGNVLDVPDRRAAWGRSLNGLLLGPSVDKGLQWLQDARVLHFLMPEVAAMVGFDKTCAVHHKDIWDHTKIVTQKAVPDLVVRWAALCHDIGKIWTRTVNKSGKVHFFRHEDHGALLFEGIAHRVGLPQWLTDRVSYLIANHSRVNLYQDDWTDSAVRRLIRETENHLPDLLAFSKADFTTKREARIEEMRRLLADLEARILRVAEEDAKEPPLSKGLGNTLMVRFGLPPCRLIGDLKKTLEETIARGDLTARAEDAYYVDWIQDQPALIARIRAAGGMA